MLVGVIKFVLFYGLTQISSLLYVLAGVLGIPLPGSPPHACVGAMNMHFGTTRASTPLCVDTPRLMVCANHRSWADFIVDMAILGNPIALSRLAVRDEKKNRDCRSERLSAPLSGPGGRLAQVMLALPFTGVYSWLFGTAIVFQRGKQRGKKDWLNDVVYEFTEQCPGQPLLVYPEGHRNILPTSLPLRSGTLKMAHAMRIPVQARARALACARPPPLSIWRVRR